VDNGNQSAVSGESLKKLMTDGTLPGEYISEDNLNALLGYELEQMGDDEYYDTQVIEYCSKLLVENYTADSYKTQKQQRYDEIMARIKQNGKEMNKHGRRVSSPVKRFIAACALTVVIVSALSVAAINYNLLDAAVHLTKKMLSAIMGNEIEQDDISRVAFDTREYKTIEEFKNSENIDVIVPTWLPGSVKIEKIAYDYGKEKMINIHYDDGVSLLTIILDSAMPDDTGDAQIYENGNIEFHMFADSNIIWWESNGDFYNLICGFDIIDNVDKVIEHIK